MIGLDEAGKSSILRYLKKSNEGIEEGPTVGFNCEKVSNAVTIWYYI